MVAVKRKPESIKEEKIQEEKLLKNRFEGIEKEYIGFIYLNGKIGIFYLTFATLCSHLKTQAHKLCLDLDGQNK